VTCRSINVNMAKGRTDDQKRAFMAAITQAAPGHHRRAARVDPVWITEFETTEFMAAGETMADRRAREAAAAAEEK
jgi:phenylpyruvate tautomerase PptA (4-oxalocrotonate tautomerase family)